MGKTLSLEYPIYKRTPRKSYVNRVKEQIRCRDAYTLGLTGRGVCVAVLDTGAYPHRDFEDRISGFADVVNHRPGPYDDCGHGTHICGIIGGSGAVSDGRYQGMAPGCTLAAVKVLDRKGNGSAADVLAGIGWILEGPAGDPDREYFRGLLWKERNERGFGSGKRRQPGLGCRACGGGGRRE